MQNRSNIHISSIIVFLSILTISLQFATYYFISSFYAIIGISCLILIICCHILLERTVTYEACFIYIILNVFISLIITILTYFGKDYSFTFIPYTGTLIAIVAINWFIPTLHCFLRYLFDYGTRIDSFLTFYRNSSIVFLLFYVGIIIYGSFFTAAFPWAYQTNSEAVNFSPFMVISTQISDYIYKQIPLSDISVYLSSRILIFMPYGFYCTLIIRKQTRLFRFFILLLFPVILEILQYFIYPTRCDIDDIIYALIGGILGSLWFWLINLISKSISGKDFLVKDTVYRFSNSSLHF